MNVKDGDFSLSYIFLCYFTEFELEYEDPTFEEKKGG